MPKVGVVSLTIRPFSSTFLFVRLPNETFLYISISWKSISDLNFFPRYINRRWLKPKVLSSKLFIQVEKAGLFGVLLSFFSSSFYLLLLHVCKSQVNDSRVWDFAACVVLFLLTKNNPNTIWPFSKQKHNNDSEEIALHFQLHWSNVSV